MRASVAAQITTALVPVVTIERVIFAIRDPKALTVNHFQLGWREEACGACRFFSKIRYSARGTHA
jgi:hypothetical protein